MLFILIITILFINFADAMYDWRPLQYLLCALHVASLFPFDNGVPKCHKRWDKFICEQLAKVSKIYCFLIFQIW